MSDVEVEAELPLDKAGARLLRAREAAGLNRKQVCAILRIPERHLIAIETGDYGALPARTYAVGFSRSYAKAVGLNPDEIAVAVREELAEQQPVEPRRAAQTFEPGDPARVPGSGLVWLAALGIAVVLVAVFFLARTMIAPAMSLPSILPEETATAPAAVAASAPAQPASAGPVVFTALEPKVWVKFTDTAGNQLLQKELAQNESWTVPSDLADVRLSTARPDALGITIAGQQVARLSEKQQALRDVPVTATALLSRVAAAPAPVAPNTAAPAQPQARPRQTQRDRAAVASSPVAAVPSSPASEPAPTAEVPAT